MGPSWPDHGHGKGSALSLARLWPGTALDGVSNPVSVFGQLLIPPPAQPVLGRGCRWDTFLQRRLSDLRGSPTPHRRQCPSRFCPSSSKAWLACPQVWQAVGRAGHWFSEPIGTKSVPWAGSAQAAGGYGRCFCVSDETCFLAFSLLLAVMP